MAATQNNRIIYSCQAVGIGPTGQSFSNAVAVHGVQSIGITTNFNLEQVFELGQIEIYENIEGVPDVEITMEKVLDGYDLIYHLATTGANDGGGLGLLNRLKQRCDVALGIFAEAFDNVASAEASGDASMEVQCTGMYVSSLSYTLPTEGNATESVTLVGNHKQWIEDGSTFTSGGANIDIIGFGGADEPAALNDSAQGGVQRREDVIISASQIPTSIYGGSSAHIQNVSISSDFNREEIYELGQKIPYFRPAQFPVEVSCEIEVISTSGDFVQAIESGDPDLDGTKYEGNNTSEETISFQTRAGYKFNLGAKNRLQSVSYGGGDATGGNASMTYSYINFNDLDVTFNSSYSAP
jgi:hypothetical protein